MPPLGAVPRGQRVWDVGNGVAHVRATLDAWLDDHGAYLDRDLYARALQSLLIVFWQLSGFEHDWKTLRYVWELRGFRPPSRRDDSFVALNPMQFLTEQRAYDALAGLQARRAIILAVVEKARPRGAYDPSYGQAFSTYSRRILTFRIADWYRSDEDFGDTRYEGNRGRDESLEALVERWERDGTGAHDNYLDQRGPGSRADFVDELNRHAYQEPIEEVLNNAAIGR